MTAHQTFTTSDVWSPSWPVRWEQARGTWSEQAVLMSIAAEAEHRDRDVFCAAYDAANTTNPDERAEHIATLEELFEISADAERLADRCEAYEVTTGRDWDTSPALWLADDALRGAERSTYGMGAA